MQQVAILFFTCLCIGLSSCEGEKTVQTSRPFLTPSQEEAPIIPEESNANNSFEALVQSYESTDRVIWQKPDVVINMLGDLEGKTVADIGAGTGYFSFRLVPKAQKVIAIDIEPMMITFLDSMRNKLSEEAANRFYTRLAKPTDPLLRDAEVDAAIVVNTYSYIENRIDYMKKIAQGIKPKGKLLVIDFKKNHMPIGPSDEFKVSANQVQQELVEAGYSILKADKSTLDYQYIILAEKQAAE